jgi:hypothetical protein
MNRKMLALGALVVALGLAFPQAATAQGTKTHDISAVLEGTFTYVPYGQTFYEVYALGVTSGEVQGLGRCNMFTFHYPDTGQLGTFKYPRFFLVAANGDKITGTYEDNHSVASPAQGLLALAGTFVIEGGTGRLASASGTLDVTALVTVDMTAWEWPVVWELKGTIKY